MNSDTIDSPSVGVLVLFFTGHLRKGVKSDCGDAEPLHRPHHRQRLQRERLHRGWQGGLWPLQPLHFIFVCLQSTGIPLQVWKHKAGKRLGMSAKCSGLNLSCFACASPDLWVLSKLWSLCLNFWFITLDPSCCVCSVYWENNFAVYQHINSPRFSFLSSESHWEILGWFFFWLNKHNREDHW